MSDINHFNCKGRSASYNRARSRELRTSIYNCSECGFEMDSTGHAPAKVDPTPTPSGAKPITFAPTTLYVNPQNPDELSDKPFVKPEPAPATETAREWPQDVRNVTLDPQILDEAREYWQTTSRSEGHLPEWLAYFAEQIAKSYHAAQSAADTNHIAALELTLATTRKYFDACQNIEAERDEALRKLTSETIRANYNAEGCSRNLLALQASERQVAELRERDTAEPRVSIEVYQHDWLPGFAAFHDDGRIQEGAKAHVILNLGSLLTAVHAGDLPKEDLPYMVAESLMHEAIHALESWAGVEFSEEKVEALLAKYQETYGGTHWVHDSQLPQSYSEIEAERDAFQEALTKIADGKVCGSYECDPTPTSQEIAKAALAQAKKES